MHLRLCSPTVTDSLASASFMPLLLNKDKCVTDSPPPPVCGRLIFPRSVRTDYYSDYLAERRSKQGVAPALQDLLSSCFILHDRRRVGNIFEKQHRFPNEVPREVARTQSVV